MPDLPIRMTTDNPDCGNTSSLQSAKENPLHIKFIVLTLAFNTTIWTAPPHTSTYYYKCQWMSDALLFPHNEVKSHSPKLSPALFLSGGMICQPPPELNKRTSEQNITSFKKKLKTHLFCKHLLHTLKPNLLQRINKNKFSSAFLLFSSWFPNLNLALCTTMFLLALWLMLCSSFVSCFV